MKRLQDDETNLLFDWVTSWYPSEVRPKIAILLLNQKEWTDFFNESKNEKMTRDEFERAFQEFTKDLPADDIEELRKLNSVPIQEKEAIIRQNMPHFGTATDKGFDDWVNETMGMCFNINELKHKYSI
jgi:hypothetical protein